MIGDRVRVLRITPSDDPKILGREGYISKANILSYLPMPKAVIYVVFPDINIDQDNLNIRSDGSYALYKYQICNEDRKLRRTVNGRRCD